MYTKFFDLKEKPFNLTPSPRFLYLSETHREALAMLTYGVMEKKGFVLLTGEVGTGKTTIVQALMQNLEGSAECFYLSNPILTPPEFHDYLGSSLLKKRVHYESKADFLLDFEELFRACRERKKNLLLIIDDAQKLSHELLEELRLLSNLETSEEKFINIFLVGQTELNDRLNEPRCRPLLQRIGLRHHISPLDLKDTQAYLETRLKIAGAGDKPSIFTKGAVQAIFECSGGTPRMINILADNAMLLAYSKGKKKISREMIEECYRELSVHETAAEAGEIKPVSPAAPRARPWARRRAWFGLLGLAIAGGLWFLARPAGIQIPTLLRPGTSSEKNLPESLPEDGSRVTRTILKAEGSPSPPSGRQDTALETMATPGTVETPPSTVAAQESEALSPPAKPSKVPELSQTPGVSAVKETAAPSPAAKPSKEPGESKITIPDRTPELITPPIPPAALEATGHVPSAAVASQTPETGKAPEAQTEILKRLELKAGQDVWRAVLDLYGVELADFLAAFACDAGV